ncbi:hypothetical protein [Gottfriedia acidiceleris]|uniref:Uncharacterized protein n=1 Tax=Gottfriedia acidiceleris TaxID=371036 RepID=A0ABY4JTH4_9BACI|nr:hypothetical protein [Gottfriedia acidiceleris]UPM56103.1 hypothetical protein MY490_09825 [Gottfriedia acidiceleris]
MSKQWVAILFLIFFFPVGLYLMWRHKHFPVIARIIVSAFFGIFILLSIFSEDPSMNVAKDNVKEEKAAPVVAKEKKDNKPVEKEAPKKKKEQAKSEPVKKSTDLESPVSPKVGLGDTLSLFEKHHGENNGDKELGRFENDYILPVFLDDKAWNITLQFESTSTKRRDFNEAVTIAKGFIPSDATKVKEYAKDEMTTVIEYKSNKLKTVFPAFPSPEEVGTCIAIIHYDDGNKNNVFSVVVSLGTNP